MPWPYISFQFLLLLYCLLVAGNTQNDMSWFNWGYACSVMWMGIQSEQNVTHAYTWTLLYACKHCQQMKKKINKIIVSLQTSRVWNSHDSFMGARYMIFDIEIKESQIDETTSQNIRKSQMPLRIHRHSSFPPPLSLSLAYKLWEDSRSMYLERQYWKIYLLSICLGIDSIRAEWCTSDNCLIRGVVQDDSYGFWHDGWRRSAYYRKDPYEKRSYHCQRLRL